MKGRAYDSCMEPEAKIRIKEKGADPSSFLSVGEHDKHSPVPPERARVVEELNLHNFSSIRLSSASFSSAGYTPDIFNHHQWQPLHAMYLCFFPLVMLRCGKSPIIRRSTPTLGLTHDLGLKLHTLVCFCALAIKTDVCVLRNNK